MDPIDSRAADPRGQSGAGDRRHRSGDVVDLFVQVALLVEAAVDDLVAVEVRADRVLEHGDEPDAAQNAVAGAARYQREPVGGITDDDSYGRRSPRVPVTVIGRVFCRKGIPWRTGFRP